MYLCKCTQRFKNGTNSKLGQSQTRKRNFLCNTEHITLHRQSLPAPKLAPWLEELKKNIPSNLWHIEESNYR